MRPNTAGPVAAGVAVEAIAGVVWWAVGSAVLPVGVGTLVLAVGLAVAVALVLAGRRRPVSGDPPSGMARRGLVRTGALALALVAAAVVGLGYLGLGELGAPVAAMIVGAHLLPLAGVLQRRGCLALGAALMVLGAGGGVLALRSAGELYPQGLVGSAAGTLFWVAAALRLGLHRELRAGIGSR